MPNSGKPAPDLRYLYLSPASRQALMGLRALSLLGETGFVLVADLARQARLPKGSLAKVFQRLASRGLLLSQRGPGGGYMLSRPAAAIVLADVLRAVQDIIPGGHPCLLGNRRCGDGGFCPVHEVVITADRFVIERFEAVSLADFAASKGWT